jgi:hypothetical protein
MCAGVSKICTNHRPHAKKHRIRPARAHQKNRQRQTAKTRRNQHSVLAQLHLHLLPINTTSVRTTDRRERETSKTNLRASPTALSLSSCSCRAWFSALSARFSSRMVVLLPSDTGPTRRACCGRGAGGMRRASASRISTRSWRTCSRRAISVAYWSSASSVRASANCRARRVAASETKSCCRRAVMLMLAS